MKTFNELLKDEVSKACDKHAPINSVHEGYAVLLEEVDEVWDEVKKRERNMNLLLKELVQVAAMAQRTAEDVVIPLLKKNDETKNI